MAKYQIIYRCGHEVTMNLVGKTADRERRIKWEEERDCLECSRARELAAAKEANAGLPALVGSDKQVAWAETLRAKRVAEMDVALGEFRTRAEAARSAGKGDAQLDEMMAALESGAAAAKAEPAAKWWIDNQHVGGRTIVEGIFRSAIQRIKGGA